MMNKISENEIAIAIPVYTEKLDSNALLSLKQLDRYLSKFDRFFIAPRNLSKGAINRRNYKIARFDKSFFVDRNTYNKLLLNKVFYKTFEKYKYILIYQLDALVFSNKLKYWVNKKYDYIAAPWFRSVIAYLSNKSGLPVSGGNGGFSLRNIQSSLKVMDKVEKEAKRSSENKLVHKLWFALAVLTGKSHQAWLKAPADNYPFNEDGFWSLEAPKYLTSYKVAPLKVAVKFAFERFPRKCFGMNKNKLPFGAHAWERYDKNFWLPFLLQK